MCNPSYVHPISAMLNLGRKAKIFASGFGLEAQGLGLAKPR